MGHSRIVWQTGLVALGPAVIAIPPVAVGLSDTASADPLWTALRLVALEALSLVFCNIVTGAFRPLFYRVFKARKVHRFHVVTGVTGFSLALAHGIMVIIFGISGYSRPPALVGPTVLAVLALVILSALTRRRLRYTWRWIHRLNYLIFAAILAHGLILGYDLGQRVLLKVCFGIYAAVVAAGLMYRLVGMIKQRRAAA